MSDGRKLFFVDTEFIEDGRTIDLISIGIVGDDGREFYCEFDFDPSKASAWVKENVLPHLSEPYTIREWAARAIVEFVGPRPEFWGYYADYDWVALCQLFGRMVDLPKGWSMYCRDLKQWCDDLGNPRLPEQGKGEHHALSDARWNRDAYRFLASHATRRAPPERAVIDAARAWRAARNRSGPGGFMREADALEAAVDALEAP